MRSRKIVILVCATVLCCAAPAAFCQSESLAAGMGVSDDASQGGSATGGVGALSGVSADANAMTNAEGGASMNAESVSGAVASGAGIGTGAGSAEPSAGNDFRIGASSNSSAGTGRLEFGLERGSRGGHRSELIRKEVSGRSAMLPGRIRYGIIQAEQRGSGRVSRAREDSTQNRGDSTRSLGGAARQMGASYTTDFPDSTRGTALLSPPDSNASPLEWTPGLNYAFPDFAAQQFLAPGLGAGHSVGTVRHEAARFKALPAEKIPGDDLKSSDWSTSMSDSLQTHVPDPLADLNSH